MTRRRKNAGEGYGYMFHGSFSKKADAVAKERKTKGAWVKSTMTNQGMRYLVMSPRTNPIRRKNPGRTMVFADRGLGQFTASRFDKVLGNVTAAGFTKKEAITELRNKIRDLKRGRGKNPTELLVMGANPSQTFNLAPGEIVELENQTNGPRRITIRTNPSFVSANPPDRFTAAHAIARGISKQAPGLVQTKRQKRVAGMVRRARKHKYDWIPSEGLAPGMNPAVCGKRIGGETCTRKPKHRGPCLPQGATLRPISRLRHGWKPRGNPSAAALRESFTGKEAEWIDVTNEPHMPAGDYAQLGELLALYVKPRAGGQVQMISFRKADRPIMVSDETARQIYFVGGNQDLGAALAAFGALERSAGIFELGEARRIDYKQRKEHVPDPDVDEWRHAFGEESGIMPIAVFDRNTRRLLLEGGEYQVRTEGIVN